MRTLFLSAVAAASLGILGLWTPASRAYYPYRPVVSGYYGAPAYYAPVTAYYAPAPVYYAPVTRYYAPAAPVVPVTAYYAPAPAYYAAPVVTYRVPLFPRLYGPRVRVYYP